MHVLLGVCDGYPKARIGFSMFCQLVHCQLLRQFPMLDWSSPLAMLSAAAALGNHFLWFDFFMRNHRPTSELVAFYTLLVWLTPFCFLVSMSNSTQGLPNFGTGPLLCLF